MPNQSLQLIQKQTLINLYQQTNGENWNRTWDLSTPPETWYGVKITNGNVIELSLNGNLLHGQLPSLTNLNHLKKIDVGSNELSGSVNWIAGLPNLEHLDLSNNQFEGQFPNALLTLSPLKTLHLGYNKWDKPTTISLSNLVNLESLDLSNIGLEEIPNDIRFLTHLKSLQLADNQISSNFQFLSQIPQLSKLNLAGNQLSNLPQTLSQLKQLKQLDLSYNELNESSFLILRQFKLEWLSLEHNKIKVLTQPLSQLKQLVHLNLGRNKIESGVEVLSQLSTLQQLFLNHNNLEGNFPNQLLGLPHLMMLNLSSNQLSGDLSQSLPAITDISNNRFTLEELEIYIKNHSKSTELIYFPQRYDDAKAVYAALGSTAKLNQNLDSSKGYTFRWYKDLKNLLPAKTEQLVINDIKKEDYTPYTAEAYYINSEFTEFVFFREPISLEEGLGTKEQELLELSIYPNPTKDYINILSKNLEIDQIYLHDITGKRILNTTNTKINISSMPSGTYLLSIKTRLGSIKTFKVIKL